MEQSQNIKGIIEDLRKNITEILNGKFKDTLTDTSTIKDVTESLLKSNIPINIDSDIRNIHCNYINFLCDIDKKSCVVTINPTNFFTALLTKGIYFPECIDSNINECITDDGRYIWKDNELYFIPLVGCIELKITFDKDNNITFD